MSYLGIIQYHILWLFGYMRVIYIHTRNIYAIGLAYIVILWIIYSNIVLVFTITTSKSIRRINYVKILHFKFETVKSTSVNRVQKKLLKQFYMNQFSLFLENWQQFKSVLSDEVKKSSNLLIIIFIKPISVFPQISL